MPIFNENLFARHRNKRNFEAHFQIEKERERKIRTEKQNILHSFLLMLKTSTFILDFWMRNTPILSTKKKWKVRILILNRDNFLELDACLLLIHISVTFTHRKDDTTHPFIYLFMFLCVPSPSFDSLETQSKRCKNVQLHSINMANECSLLTDKISFTLLNDFYFVDTLNDFILVFIKCSQVWMIQIWPLI